MTKLLTRPRNSIPPLKIEHGEIKFFSPRDKANKIACFLATTVTPHTDVSEPLFIDETDMLVEDFLNEPCSEKIKPTNIKEVFDYFKKTKNNK